MEHRLNLVFRHNIANQLLIADVALNERPPLHRPLVTGTEIVDGDWLESGLRDTLRAVAANVPGTAREQDPGHFYEAAVQAFLLDVGSDKKPA
jgi:hypothetical protein